MPTENIGACGGARSTDSRWIKAELALGICYIRHACAEPPAGFDLGIVWREHDSGEYATIGITWEGPQDPPWEYLSRAENALTRFDAAVAWSELAPEEESNACGEPDSETTLLPKSGI